MYRFTAATIALLVGDCIVSTRRDNIPTIPCPDLWELPGGRADNGETPWQCIAREISEEIDITLVPEWVVWEKRFANLQRPGQLLHFYVAQLPEEMVPHLHLGSEGQDMQLLPITDFLEHSHAVIFHQHMLRDYLRLQGLEPLTIR